MLFRSPSPTESRFDARYWMLGAGALGRPRGMEWGGRRDHQMVKTEIRLIVFFVAKDGEALYSQQKQDLELTVAQVMNSLLPNSDLNLRK